MGIKEKVKGLPVTPGVYIMKGGAGEVLYIGKAGNLRKRVSSYFYPNKKMQDRIRILVGKIAEIEHIPTSTEAEALIYENGLIKQLSPKYNVALRDDKSYPMLKLTVNEKFPRLFIARQKKADGALYYGPYTNATLLREAVIISRQLFPLRSCGKMAKSPCLNYHIKQCLAPCAGRIDGAHYGEIISELKLFLEGRRQDLLKRLSDRMVAASRAENFEEASRCREAIEAFSALKDKVNYGPARELDELKSVLGSDKELNAIEAFDVSNIMGKEAVGVMIYFYKGRPNSNEYRKFRIRSVSGIDDYSMIREIVRRRYGRLKTEGKRMPDLVVIDGGKGHLSAALDELRLLGLEEVNMIAIAKQFEHIYTKDRKDPIILPKESKALHLVRRMRDEAHRFAVKYHSALRSGGMEVSELDDIRGIGEKRKRALLKCFGSVDRIKEAGLEELVKVKGMNERAARNIAGYFSA